MVSFDSYQKKTFYDIYSNFVVLVLIFLGTDGFLWAQIFILFRKRFWILTDFTEQKPRLEVAETSAFLHADMNTPVMHLLWKILAANLSNGDVLDEITVFMCPSSSIFYIIS